MLLSEVEVIKKLKGRATHFFLLKWRLAN